MMPAFQVPPELDAALLDFDKKTSPLDLHAVSQKVAEVRKSLGTPTTEEMNCACWAEVLAFSLTIDLPSSNPWGTYFAPVGSWQDESGSTRHFPDIVGTDPRTIDQWKWRAETLSNPILTARYADLVWDLAATMAQQKPDHKFAALAVDAYLNALSRDLHEDDHDRFAAAKRALDIAESLRDEVRIDAARAALLVLHRNVMKGGKPLWWRAPDRLLNDKNSRLTDDERGELIRDLETIVEIKTRRTDTQAFDPHQAQDAAERLVTFYQKGGKRDEVRRLQKLVGETFEHAASISGPMLAASFLQTAVNAFKKSGSKEDASRARIAMESAINRSHDEMQSFTAESTITAEDMEKFLASIVLPDVAPTMVRLAVEFLPKRDALERRVAELAKESPLAAMITQTIMAEDRVTAVVGSVQDDPSGRAIVQSAQEMALSDVFLVAALERAIDVHKLTPDHFVSWTAQSALFDDLTLLHEGVLAWFNDDYVKALHVLVPQVEVALRSIAGANGLPVTKAHRAVAGASVALGMGDILANQDALTVLGEDLTLHFLTLYSDPRGINLRNELAHGLLGVTSMSYGMTCRVIHTLLLLGIWKQISSARRAKDQPE